MSVFRPTDETTAERPHVIVVGAGFAGLEVVKTLSKAPVDVTLIDRNNYHKFQPLLYEVAMAGLEADDIAHNVRDIFRKQPNVRFRMGTVEDVDRSAREVHLADGAVLPYDYLVVGAGAVTNYFGVPGAEQYAFPLKNIEDAIQLRNHTLRQFEKVDRQRGATDEGALTFVLVGGGPTGVEMAGALVELFSTLEGDYATLDVQERARVVLVEMEAELLPPYAPSLRNYTRDTLEKRGVEVRTRMAVERVEAGGVQLSDGSYLPTQTLIWGAGVRAHPLADALHADQRRDGRVVVDRTLSLPDDPRVYVVGDMAAARDAEGNPYPGVAQVAMQQGRHAGRQLWAHHEGRERTFFEYRNLGQMATIGRNAAVGELPGGIKLKGFVAWVLWVFIHIAKIVGFRNRASAFVNWMYNYFTYQRSARLILDVPSGPASTLDALVEGAGTDERPEERSDASADMPFGDGAVGDVDAPEDAPEDASAPASNAG